jgi:hypothetical protein
MRSTTYPEMRVVHSLESEDTQWTELVRMCLDEITCARLLRFLANNPSTVMTADDLAAMVGCGVEGIEAALGALNAFGLLRRVDVESLQFFGLAESARAHHLAQHFRSWCEDQRTRWRALEGLVACA